MSKVRPAGPGSAYAPDLAAVGSLLADPARAQMLGALAGGLALPAGELASGAGISPATASFHLGKLLDAGWLVVERQGRHRYYRVASVEVMALVETVAAMAPLVPPRSFRSSTSKRQLSRARVCYDHMAGDLGVAVADAFVATGLVGSDTDGLALSTLGATRLEQAGIDISGLRSGRRPLTRTCLDWTVRRHHLGGAVAAAFLHRWLELGAVRRRPGSRVLDPGALLPAELERWGIGYDPTRPPSEG